MSACRLWSAAEEWISDHVSPTAKLRWPTTSSGQFSKLVDSFSGLAVPNARPSAGV